MSSSSSSSGTRNSSTVGGSINCSQLPVRSSSTNTWQNSNQYSGRVSSQPIMTGSTYGHESQPAERRNLGERFASSDQWSMGFQQLVPYRRDPIPPSPYQPFMIPMPHMIPLSPYQPFMYQPFMIPMPRPPFDPYMPVIGTHGIPDPSSKEGWASRQMSGPSAFVPQIQDQFLGVPEKWWIPSLRIKVVGCKIDKDDEVRPWQHPFVLLKYGDMKYTKEGSISTTNEICVIDLIEGVREMDIYVFKNNNGSFIDTGKIDLHKVLSQGVDESVWPLKKTTSGRSSGEVHLIMHFKNPILYNAPPEIMDDSPGKVEESKRTIWG